jgi:hypothetical protein
MNLLYWIDDHWNKTEKIIRIIAVWLALMLFIIGILSLIFGGRKTINCSYEYDGIECVDGFH